MGKFDKYELGTSIGFGGYSTVCSAKNIETKDRLSVKIVKKSTLKKKNLDIYNEINILLFLK